MIEPNKYYNENNFYICEDIGESMQDELIPALTDVILDPGTEHINVWINTDGGDVHTTMHIVNLFDIAKSKCIVVKTIVSYKAYSGGSIIAIAGSPGERYINHNGEHLVHYGNTSIDCYTPKQVERVAEKSINRYTKTLMHYLKYTSFERSVLENAMSDDSLFLQAEDCINFGLADKYVEEFK